MKRVSLGLLASLLTGLGFVSLVSPFPLWWIHGGYERYVWIISCPSPYDTFGGGPFQLFVYLGLFTIGIVLSGVGLTLRAAPRRAR